MVLENNFKYEVVVSNSACLFVAGAGDAVHAHPVAVRGLGAAARLLPGAEAAEPDALGAGRQLGRGGLGVPLLGVAGVGQRRRDRRHRRQERLLPGAAPQDDAAYLALRPPHHAHGVHQVRVQEQDTGKFMLFFVNLFMVI